MAQALWHEIGKQFRHPTGTNGRLMGHVMKFVNARPYQLAVTALAPISTDRVLELGCGPGAGIKLLSHLADRGQVHGLDQSDTMLDQAKILNHREIRTGRVHLHLGSFDKIPLANCSVDKILAVNVAYFWKAPESVMQESRRVLRPGGRMAIYVTDEKAMKSWKFAGTDTHRHFNFHSLEQMLRSGPFADSDIAITPVLAGFGVPGLIAVIRDLKALGQHSTNTHQDPA